MIVQVGINAIGKAAVVAVAGYDAAACATAVVIRLLFDVDVVADMVVDVVADMVDFFDVAGDSVTAVDRKFNGIVWLCVVHVVGVIVDAVEMIGFFFQIFGRDVVINVCTRAVCIGLVGICLIGILHLIAY